MASLKYSAEALNVLNKFYRVDIIVYVEGDDDVVFWEFLFKRLSTLVVKAEAVGGKCALKAKLTEIEEGAVNAIVAMDRDFTDFEELRPYSKLITTFGYSIENTIINSLSLGKVLNNVGRISSSPGLIGICDMWLNNFKISSIPLIQYDIENQVNTRGVNVELHNSSRFFDNGSYEISEQKINDYIGGISIELTEEVLNKITEVLDGSGRELVDLVRGHFLFSGAQRFISLMIESHKSKTPISNGALFGNLHTSFELCFDERHEHFPYYSRIISRCTSQYSH